MMHKGHCCYLQRFENDQFRSIVCQLLLPFQRNDLTPHKQATHIQKVQNSWCTDPDVADIGQLPFCLNYETLNIMYLRHDQSWCDESQ